MVVIILALCSFNRYRVRDTDNTQTDNFSFNLLFSVETIDASQKETKSREIMKTFVKAQASKNLPLHSRGKQ